MPTDPRQLRDELLVRRCQLGEPEAFDELFQRWEPRLLYYLRRLLPSEADAWDVLQRTHLAVWRGIRNLNHPASLSAWLFRIARNHAVSFCRHEMAHRSQRNDDLTADNIADVEWTPRIDQAERVHHALALLSLPQREVVTLHFLEEMSLAEIAEVTGAPIGTVKSRLHYAKRQLKELLENQGDQS